MSVSIVRKQPVVDPDEYGRLQQQLDKVLRENRALEERNRALSSRAQPGGMDQTITVSFVM